MFINVTCVHGNNVCITNSYYISIQYNVVHPAHLGLIGHRTNVKMSDHKTSNNILYSR